MKRVILMMMLAVMVIMLAGVAQAGGVLHNKSLELIRQDSTTLQRYLQWIKEKLDTKSVAYGVGYTKGLNEKNGGNLSPDGNGTTNFNWNGEAFSECNARGWKLISDRTIDGNQKDVAYTTFNEGDIFKVKVENVVSGQYVYYRLSENSFEVIDANLPFTAESSMHVSSPTLARKLSDSRMLSVLLTKYYQGWGDFLVGTYSAWITRLVTDQTNRTEFLQWAEKHLND